MKDSNSSTSSSEPIGATRHDVGSILRIGLYALVCLALLDFAIGAVTRMPSNPRQEPRTLQRYFDYGRSVEGKLRMRIGDSAETSTPVVSAGWLESDEAADEKTQASAPDKKLVAVYGQSFTHQAARALAAQDPRFEVRLLGGPAAPLSHSFTLYQQDRREHQAEIVVIGIVAGTLPLLVTMTPMTTMFEDPYPYTYPRYFVKDGKLESIQPKVRSFAMMQEALADPAKWDAFEDELRAGDLAYSPFVFGADLLDYSVVGRGIRRGYGQKHMRGGVARYLTFKGYRNADGLVDTATALLLEFGRTAREDGRTPYVLFFQDAGTGNSLAATFGPALEANGIGYLSSFEIVPPGDSQSYLKDGHFKPALLQKFVHAFDEDLGQRVFPTAQGRAAN